MPNIHFWENDDEKAKEKQGKLVGWFKKEDFADDVVITRHKYDYEIGIFSHDKLFRLAIDVSQALEMDWGKNLPDSCGTHKFSSLLPFCEISNLQKEYTPFLRIVNYNLSKAELEERIEILRTLGLDIEVQQKPSIVVCNNHNPEVTQRIQQGMTLLGFLDVGYEELSDFIPAEEKPKKCRPDCDGHNFKDGVEQGCSCNVDVFGRLS